MEIENVDSQTQKRLFANEKGDVVEQTIFDPNPTLKDTEFLRDNQSKSGNGRLVALLPIEVIEMWKQTKGIDWFTATPAEKAAILNDPDNAMFRTGGGRV